MIFNLCFSYILSNKCVIAKINFLFLHFTWDLKAAEQTARVMRANRNAGEAESVQNRRL